MTPRTGLGGPGPGRDRLARVHHDRQRPAAAPRSAPHAAGTTPAATPGCRPSSTRPTRRRPRWAGGDPQCLSPRGVTRALRLAAPRAKTRCQPGEPAGSAHYDVARPHTGPATASRRPSRPSCPPAAPAPTAASTNVQAAASGSPASAAAHSATCSRRTRAKEHPAPPAATRSPSASSSTPSSGPDPGTVRPDPYHQHREGAPVQTHLHRTRDATASTSRRRAGDSAVNMAHRAETFHTQGLTVAASNGLFAEDVTMATRRSTGQQSRGLSR